MIGPGFIGTLDGNMLSIYTASTIGKLTDIFDHFYQIISYLFPYIRTGSEIRKDMGNGHILTEFTKQLKQYFSMLCLTADVSIKVT